MIQMKQYIMTGASNEIRDSALKYSRILQVVREGQLFYGTQTGPPALGYYFKVIGSQSLLFTEAAGGGVSDVDTERVKVIYDET